MEYKVPSPDEYAGERTIATDGAKARRVLLASYLPAGGIGPSTGNPAFYLAGRLEGQMYSPWPNP